MGFQINIKYAPSLLEHLRVASSHLLETRSLLKSLAKRLRYTFQQNITESRTPTGQPFAPLKLPIRKKVTADPRPLIDSWKLVNDFDYRFVNENTIVVGDTTKYGIYHNRGTAHVPRRTFIGIRPDDEEQMRGIVGHWTAWAFGMYDAPDANVFTPTERIY